MAWPHLLAPLLSPNLRSSHSERLLAPSSSPWILSHSLDSLHTTPSSPASLPALSRHLCLANTYSWFRKPDWVFLSLQTSLTLQSGERNVRTWGCPHPGVPTPSLWDIRIIRFSAKVSGDVSRFKVELRVEEVLSCGQTLHSLKMIDWKTQQA